MRRYSAILVAALITSAFVIGSVARPPQLSANQAAAVKWSYRIYTPEDTSDLQADLDTLGQGGWELVAIQPTIPYVDNG